MNTARSYHSPLRERQAQQTAAHILDALTEIAAAPDFEGLSVKALAERAGVSERTVYRHFPDRQALVDGLSTHASSNAGWTIDGDYGVPDLEDAAALMRRRFREMDASAELTRALARLNTGSSVVASESRGRAARFATVVAEAYPQLSDADQLGVATLIHLLGSSRTWMRFTDDAGMAGEESGKYVAWVVSLVLDALESGDPVPDVGES